MKRSIKYALWLFVLAAGAASITLLYIMSEETFWGAVLAIGIFIAACLVLSKMEKADEKAERKYSIRAYKSVSGVQPHAALRKIYFK